MRFLVTVIGCLLGATLPAIAQTACPNNPDAIGTSRTIVVDPVALPRIGVMQYKSTLPLEDHEVVLTFDDGPLPPYSNSILNTLAANCVKVTYFLVGEMAHAYPGLVRRMYNEGHIIGTHSQTHPLTFNHMAEAGIDREVSGGIASVEAAAGDPRAVAPFFRIPGLLRSEAVETYLATKSLALWSADVVADDWHRGITPKQIVLFAIRRLEANKHRGVLLLHDIHPATALALPELLRELKSHGYHIVQVIPSGERPQSVPELENPSVAEKSSTSPRIIKANASSNDATVKRLTAKHYRNRGHYDRESKLSVLAKRKHKGSLEQEWPILWHTGG